MLKDRLQETTQSRFISAGDTQREPWKVHPRASGTGSSFLETQRNFVEKLQDNRARELINLHHAAHEQDAKNM